MQYEPHDYQKYAQQFIIEHPAAGLLLDMGLGKTIITLSALWEMLLDYFMVGRVLIIAPLRVARDTWPKEIEKWDHLKGITYSVVVGSEKERREALSKRAFVYIINRENVTWLIENKLFRFDMVVIDELSSFKSHQSKRFKSLRKARAGIKYIVGLTGTPAPNGLIDLWAQINLLDMGERLGRFIGGYRERYFMPDKRNRDVIFSYKPRDGAEEAIYEKISDICVSMKAKDHLQMPKLVLSNVEVEMNEKEQQMYEQLKADLILPFADGDIDAASAVGLSNKLHQMANGAVYDENGKVKLIHERKLDALEDMIEAANGKPVLIAYWFKHDRDRIIERFDATSIDKSEDISKWNQGKIPIAIIHPASAGHGLNLQEGGCHLIWFGLTWSLELYQQCNARLWRQGQKETVTIQHLITKDTIDEDVLKALEAKDCTQEALLDAVKARIAPKKK
ncbi:MAG: DEAD/DEAH box helicase [Lachnospira sp.]|nr:DEAD/DEAH box helicase [Lachnospira sp.]MDD4432107.1 DEAD/DEAH box helicase [Parabacteroides sp.]